MKKIVNRILLLGAVAAMFSACEYRDVYDAGSQYPNDKVYIAGVYESVIYKVDELITSEDAPFRYKIDAENNKLLIPLGVYRGSVWSKKDVVVELGVDNDTIQGLIESEELVGEDGGIPEILPEGKYSFDSEIRIGSGEDLGITNLAVDIPFLLENLDKRYVLGIKIVDSNVDINEDLSVIVFDITAGLIEAQPDFTYTIDEDDPLKILITNTSLFCLDYEWDFGDGSPAMTEEDPKEHVFPAVGIYDVKLTSKGTRGNLVTMTKQVHIWENITEQYIKNSGAPFVRAQLVSGRVDCLKDWDCTENVKSTYNKSKDLYVGGWQNTNGGVMDFYANEATGGALANAKIYQSFELPAGAFNAGFLPSRFIGECDGYFVVARGTSLPDAEDMASDPDVLAFVQWDETAEITQHSMEFSLEAAGTVTMGFVVSAPVDSRVQIRSVSLSK